MVDRGNKISDLVASQSLVKASPHAWHKSTRRNIKKHIKHLHRK